MIRSNTWGGQFHLERYCQSADSWLLLIHKQWPLQILSPHCHCNRMLSARHDVNWKWDNNWWQFKIGCQKNKKSQKKKNWLTSVYVHFIESLAIEVNETQQCNTDIMKAIKAIWVGNFFSQSHCNRIQFRRFYLVENRKFEIEFTVISDFNIASGMLFCSCCCCCH